MQLMPGKHEGLSVGWPWSQQEMIVHAAVVVGVVHETLVSQPRCYSCLKQLHGLWQLRADSRGISLLEKAQAFTLGSFVTTDGHLWA